MVNEMLFTLGRYHILREVAQDQLGEVYVGHDPVLDRGVLVRRSASRPGDRSQETLNYVLVRDAKIGATIQHPNTVCVVDFAKGEEGRPHLAMVPEGGRRWQRDVTLECAMRAGISVRDALEVIVGVLNGLAHIHGQGIVHRSVTPANTLLLKGGGAQLMGFGLARVLPTSPLRKRRHRYDRLVADGWSQAGVMIGTMAPEQVLGGEFDGRADLFAVGCIVYALVAGCPPFQPDNLMALYYKITHDEPDMGLFPSGPGWKGLAEVVRCALQKNPEDRYPDAAAMSEALALTAKELGGKAGRLPACTNPQHLPTGPLLPSLHVRSQAEDPPETVH